MRERYRIEGELGTGRAGSVFEAYDMELKRQVALRRFDTAPENLQDEAWRAQFFDIVSDLSRISHANILSVLDADIDEHGPFIVTGHVDGLRLSQVMKYAGQFELDELYEFTRECLDALQAAEEFGFYHHALSPSSVLATPKPSGGFHYTLMDLGHSRLIPLMSEEGNIALAKTLDPALMAPEIFEGNPAGIRSTLYMLGHLVYWLAAGGHPLAGLSLELAHAKHKAGEVPYLRSYRAGFPEAFRRWIYWLIQPDPQDRPRSVMEAIRLFPSLEDATKEEVIRQPLRMDAQSFQQDYQV